MTPTLLPCPFCGSADVEFYNTVESHFDYVVWCTDCGATTGQDDLSPEQAIARWNRRAEFDKRDEERQRKWATTVAQRVEERDALRDALAVAERNIELSRESWLRIKGERDALREALERIAAVHCLPDTGITYSLVTCAREALRGKP